MKTTTKRMLRKSRRARLDKEALFRQVGYEPHAGQLEVHLSTVKYRVLACGVRWGKTTCAAMEGLAALLSPCEESIGWVVGPDHYTADRIIKKMEVKLQKYLAHRIEEIDSRRHRIVVRNLGGGLSVVEGRSADNPNSLLGEGLSWLVVDEAARLKQEIWEEHLSQRLIDRDGWALLISTPRGPGWFYEMYRLGQESDPEQPMLQGGDEVEDEKADSELIMYASWSHPSWANPHLRPEVVERERERLPEEVFRQEYGGQFVGQGLPLCDVCLFPRQAAELKPVVFYEGEDWLHCAECGRLVYRDGLSAVTADGFYLQGIRFLCKREHGPSDME